MLTYQDIDPQKEAFVFELDDVLFPKKDYLLQVYYLFANLLEYSRLSPPASELTEFLKSSYLDMGEKNLFERAAERFGIEEHYKEAFSKLHVSAKLPLKLLLYKSVLALLLAMTGAGKKIIILTYGNPLVQLNKIKQTEWNGLEDALKVYFYDEIKLKSNLEPLDYVLQENEILPEAALSLGTTIKTKEIAETAQVDYMDIQLFLAEEKD